LAFLLVGQADQVAFFVRQDRRVDRARDGALGELALGPHVDQAGAARLEEIQCLGRRYQCFTFSVTARPRAFFINALALASDDEVSSSPESRRAISSSLSLTESRVMVDSV